MVRARFAPHSRPIAIAPPEAKPEAHAVVRCRGTSRPSAPGPDARSRYAAPSEGTAGRRARRARRQGSARSREGPPPPRPSPSRQRRGLRDQRGEFMLAAPPPRRRLSPRRSDRTLGHRSSYSSSATRIGPRLYRAIREGSGRDTGLADLATTSRGQGRPAGRPVGTERSEALDAGALGPVRGPDNRHGPPAVLAGLGARPLHRGMTGGATVQGVEHRGGGASATHPRSGIP